MKIRQGFVSNSSSSSFTILKYGVTEAQRQKILNHAKESTCPHCGQVIEDMVCQPHNAWAINETEDRIECSTYMDNFDLLTFVLAIGVLPECIIDEYHS